MDIDASVQGAPRRGRKTLKGYGFDLQAKQIIRNELVRSGISHEELVKRLAQMGVRENVPNLRNKLTRGRFSAPFLLQVMAALGVKSIDLDEALTDLATTTEVPAPSRGDQMGQPGQIPSPPTDGR